VRLLGAYAEVIERAGLESSLVPRARANEHSDAEPPLSALTFGQPSYLGQCGYITASGFGCERLS